MKWAMSSSLVGSAAIGWGVQRSFAIEPAGVVYCATEPRDFEALLLWRVRGSSSVQVEIVSYGGVES